ncbi:quinolinate synthase NadA [Phenylobacterium sp.]|jgi:quinolinate synthase|uniref:quinolinate synthase NadA n=1 Tax=Phenylobacterium sp. TaxID=1871053 RepID=UPI0025F392B6|nr:quinolinate synthase NadA [Phenylobacterium sp.]MCA6286691.1 quinolinate synthase NadA [Phenylobacterium sp.]MCA6287635.1 quinolinate synthase NadA [Phenylobacterium sp.]MCA6296756.1 quinolinate synthase NadA [Phenylobacterium sp.]MCA6299849.1 quinolinate synthase NadA [Phenylobacterium sp.]MCA6310947.1 quinolinate synthase NadA [Phenylobacterium sp.]
MSLSAAVAAHLPGFTPEVQAETAAIWEKVRRHVTPMEWRSQAPLISAINKLKRERRAVILAHNYMTTDIFHGVGDYVGDSLGLAREAARADADIIIQAGVHFMAETSKILSPDKRVLIPDLRAGCSLAASITAEDVRLMRQRYPGLPVVTYVNTSAEVKAETDICCTSANAVQVVESAAREWGVNRVILIPDEFLARNVARQTEVGIIAWRGRCEVHEQFTAEDIREIRQAHPGAEILAHPECPAEVIAEADFAGSTAAMNDYVLTRKPRQVVLITECSMADNVAADAVETEFVRPCNLCPHMKRITLENILEALVEDRHEVTVDPLVAARARGAVQRMIDLPPPAVPARYDLVRARHHVDVELI